ncbi:MAG: hypothetical protein OXH69_13290 [Acidobacteria bacterium]|nr:hypothetical protein [Acidobacteriota bacterium]
MSVPKPRGEPPAAMIAPSPPELPPADRSSRHGFRVRPMMGLTVSSEPLMSEQLDLPSTMAPAAFMRRTASASRSATCPRSRSEPAVNRTPATASASLTVRGTPWSGGGSAGTPASDIRRAVFRAASNVVVISALMCGPTFSIRAMWASTTSSGLVSPMRMRRASSAAPSVVSSSGEAGAPCSSAVALTGTTARRF